MGRPVYCRQCAQSFDSVAGELPDHCPECKSVGHWSTEPVPKVKWHLTWSDKLWLRRRGIGIDPDDDPDDGA